MYDHCAVQAKMFRTRADRTANPRKKAIWEQHAARWEAMAKETTEELMDRFEKEAAEHQQVRYRRQAERIAEWRNEQAKRALPPLPY